MNAKLEHLPELIKKILWPSFWSCVGVTIFEGIIFTFVTHAMHILYGEIGPGWTFLLIIAVEWIVWIISLAIIWMRAEPTELSIYFKFEVFGFALPAVVLFPIIVLIVILMISM